MCLVSNTSTASIAKKDITIYKLCNIYTKQQYHPFLSRMITEVPLNKIVTPYEDVEIPKLPFLLEAKGEIEISKVYHGYKIGRGYVHAYQCLYDAAVEINAADWEDKRKGIYQLVIKGYIPCGTKYYTGFKDICATSMMLEEIVDPINFLEYTNFSSLATNDLLNKLK